MRTRLTLIYTALFAICGAIVVAVSYSLVARLGASGQSQHLSLSERAGFVARCTSEQPGAHSAKTLIAQCVSYLELLGAQRQRNLTISHLLVFSLITLAVVIALAASLGWVVSGRTLRPVRQITAAARAATAHDLSSRVALRGPRDELRDLAETFDDMLSRLEAAFEAQRQFIANASHELRTPLTVMRTTIEVVLANPESTSDDLRAMAADIRGAVDRAEHLIGALLILARNERGLSVHDQVDLATVTEDVLDSSGLSGRRIHISLEPAYISGDPVLAERLVANLVDNAFRYNVPAGDIWIKTRTIGASSQLTVANTGPILSQNDAERIFQPFQRIDDRASHEGSGLGLTIVTSIAAIHGGIAAARPRRDGGLTVTVTIPSANTSSAQSSTQTTETQGVPP